MAAKQTAKQANGTKGFTAKGTDSKPREVPDDFRQAVVQGVESGQSYRELADDLGAKKVKSPTMLGDLYRAVRVVAHAHYGNPNKAQAAMKKGKEQRAKEEAKAAK